MIDPIQAEWSSLGAVWQSRAASIDIAPDELATIAFQQDRQRRHLRVLIGVAWVAAFGTAAWLMLNTPFKGLGILLLVFFGVVSIAAASLSRPEVNSGQRSVLPSIERAISRQEGLLRTVWAGAAVGMVALAAVLSAAAHLLLLSGSGLSGIWIALGIAGVYSLACALFCGLQGWRARAELARLQELHAHLSRPGRNERPYAS